MGIISTYVENTQGDWDLDELFKDHLHIRGEYIILMMDHNSLIGSSPHTWRIPHFKTLGAKRYRIISTYVENTRSAEAKSMLIGDHLHIRGEYYSISIVQLVSIGSSPHTWRILNKKHFLPIFFRIISTYVENTTY